MNSPMLKRISYAPVLLFSALGCLSGVIAYMQSDQLAGCGAVAFIGAAIVWVIIARD